MRNMIVMRTLFFIFSIVACSLFSTEDITGFWKSLDDDGNPQCVFGVYEYEGVHYGKIIGTYDDDGVMRNTIYNPISRAEGVPGNPHTCGLDIVHSLNDNGISFAGFIVDPSKGKTYKCEVWPQDGKLIVRGKLFIFGKNISWYPVTKGDFPKGFQMPDMSKFIPSVPQV